MEVSMLPILPDTLRYPLDWERKERCFSLRNIWIMIAWFAMIFWIQMLVDG